MESSHRQKGGKKGNFQQQMDCSWQDDLPLEEGGGLPGRLPHKLKVTLLGEAETSTMYCLGLLM